MTIPFNPQGGVGAPGPAQPQPQRPGSGFSYDPSQLPPPQQPTQQQPQFQQQQQQPANPGFGGQQQQQQPTQQQQAPVQPPFVPNLTAQPQQQQQQFQQPQTADLNMVLTGPNIPAQLQGRTLGEGIAYFNAMERTARAAMQHTQTPQTQSMQPVQQQQQPQQQQQNAPATEFFRDPNAAIERVLVGKLPQMLQQALGPMLAPVTQQATLAGASQAQQTVIHELGGPQRFQQLYPYMAPYLSAGVDLTNPDSWRLAARAAIGDLTLRGQQFQPQQQQGATPAGAYPVQVVGQNGQPVPGMPAFFTESPSGGGGAGGRVQLTQLQRQAFEAFKQIDPVTWHSEEVYLAWLGGAQPTRR